MQICFAAFLGRLQSVRWKQNAKGCNIFANTEVDWHVSVNVEWQIHISTWGNEQAVGNVLIFHRFKFRR